MPAAHKSLASCVSSCSSQYIHGEALLPEYVDLLITNSRSLCTGAFGILLQI